MADIPEQHAPTLLLVGASRGIGLAMASAFVEKVWHIIGTVREDGRSGLQDLAETHPDQVTIERLDITDPGQIAALREKLADRAYDMLFVNAGTANHDQDETIAETSDEEFVRVMLTNALGVMRTVEGLQRLVKPSGLIGVMSSGQGSIAKQRKGRPRGVSGQQGRAQPIYAQLCRPPHR